MNFDEPLKANEVGSYGDLAARTNPEGFVIFAIPAFEDMLPFIAQQYGRELTAAEIEAEKQKSVCMVLPPAIAEQMTRARARRAAGEG